MWDAAVQCLQQYRVAEHHLSAPEWLNEGMYLEDATQERLLASSYIDESAPQPIKALFLRALTAHREAEAAAAEANAPGAGVPPPSAPEAAPAPAARAAAGRATAAAGETPAGAPRREATSGRGAATATPSTCRLHGGTQAQTRREGRRHVGQPRVRLVRPHRGQHLAAAGAYATAQLRDGRGVGGGLLQGTGPGQVAHMRRMRGHMYQTKGIQVRLRDSRPGAAMDRTWEPTPATGASPSPRRQRRPAATKRPSGTRGRAASGDSSGAGRGSGAARNSEMLHSRLRSGDRV